MQFIKFDGMVKSVVTDSFSYKQSGSSLDSVVDKNQTFRDLFVKKKKNNFNRDVYVEIHIQISLMLNLIIYFE